MTTIITKAPNKHNDKSSAKLFLAGSIDMGSAEDWQEHLSDFISKRSMDVEILNPRRADWDSSWTQDISHKGFSEQVNWELDSINDSDVVAFYFDPNGKAPITLMELGACLTAGKNCIVCCPEGYWRRGNVQIICDRHSVSVLNSLEDLCNHVCASLSGMISGKYFRGIIDESKRQI